MTINVERFSPDSCACVIDLSFDSSLTNPPATLVQFINKCVFHSIVSDLSAFNAIFDENQRRSSFMNGLVVNFPAIFSSNSTSSGTWKDTIGWSSTLTGVVPNRVLNFNVNSTDLALTQTQLHAAQTWANNNIGVGKVVITNN